MSAAGRVAYEDNAAGDWDVLACDVSSLLATPPLYTAPAIIADGPGNQLDPAIDGPHVVYEDNSRGNWDIAVYDLQTGSKRFLTSNRAAQVDPAVRGNKVVWADDRNGNWDIYACDLQTGNISRLTTSAAAQRAPQLGPDGVVYQDRRNGQWDIYSYTFKTRAERRLTSEPHSQTAPQIDEDGATIVFQDDRNGTQDIYLRHGKTGILKPVARETGDQILPSIRYGDVVWSDGRSGDPMSTVAVSLALTVPSRPERDAALRQLRLPPRQAERGLRRGGGPRIKVASQGTTMSARVGADGTYHVSLPHVKRKVTVRAWFPGDADHLPAWGGSVTVKPMAKLSTPRLTPERSEDSIIVIRNHFRVSGLLWPRHRAGTRAVTLEIYAYAGANTWSLLRRVRVSVSSAGSASSYRTAVIKAPYASKWRARAIHEDADHAQTVSSWGYL